jgi:hypothetical protein
MESILSNVAIARQEYISCRLLIYIYDANMMLSGSD